MLDDVKDSSRENAVSSWRWKDANAKSLIYQFFLFSPARSSCFLVSKMLDLQYLPKSEKLADWLLICKPRLVIYPMPGNNAALRIDFTDLRK